MSNGTQNPWKLALKQAYLSLVFGALFLVGTGLVTDWGYWYSDNTHYREQTEALLKGSLGLFDTPAALCNDLAWHHGAIHQVWGLGVPCWRLPFEILARAVGQPAFPDRLAFGAALSLLAFLTIRILLPSPVVERQSPVDSLRNPFRISGVLVLLVFPPWVAMCRFRFDVYEEAVAYAYLYGVGLFIGLMAFVRAPTKSKLLLISLLAGLAPFVRPPLLAYSISTMLLLGIYSRRAGFGWRCFLAGCGLSGLGGLLLFLTNYVRFGAGSEFGHALNLNGYPTWLFTRIYNPFQDEPALSAARELFGFLFCNPELNVFDWGHQNLFWGQSATPRWRHFYLTCYDMSFLVLLALSWAVLLWGNVRQRRCNIRVASEFQAAGSWSIIGVIVLAAFYLRTPILANRYALDFGAGFAAAIAGLLFGLEGMRMNAIGSKRRFSWCVLAGIVTWIGWEIATAKTRAGNTLVLDQSETMTLLRREYAKPELPNKQYARGDDLNLCHIPYNGSGWSASDGRLDKLAIFFVADPQCLELHLSQADPQLPVDISKVEAKVGLESLVIRSVIRNEQEFVITFEGPQRPVYRKGIQIVFIAYVDKKDLLNMSSPLLLSKVAWKP